MISLILLLLVVCVGAIDSSPGVQSPAEGPFSYTDLVWQQASKQAKKGPQNESCGRLDVLEARIPWHQVADFIAGENLRGCCDFFKQRTKENDPNMLTKLQANSFLESTSYHCNHGPEDLRVKGGDLVENAASKRKGSVPNTCAKP